MAIGSHHTCFAPRLLVTTATMTLLRRCQRNCRSRRVRFCAVCVLLVVVIYQYVSRADDPLTYAVARTRPVVFTAHALPTFHPAHAVMARRSREELHLRSVLYKSDDDFAQSLHQHAINMTILLTLVDVGYVDIALNFVEMSLHPLRLRNHLFVCLDAPSQRRLSTHGVGCHRLIYVTSADDFRSDKSNVGDFGSSAYYRNTNLKTLVVLRALRLDYSVLMIDADISLFKPPMSYLNCDKCDVQVQMDRSQRNSGFVFVRASGASRALYRSAWELYAGHRRANDQAYFNMALTSMAANDTIVVRELSTRLFPCGNYYFGLDNRVFYNKPVCPECVMAHNNYMGTKAGKIYRFKENLLWAVDNDGYYTNRSTKYLVYDNPFDFGDDTMLMEKSALRNALAICRLTNRVLVLPSFRCCDCNGRRCAHARHRCSLLSVLDLRSFDAQFSGLYREHSFPRNRKVRWIAARDVILINTTVYDRMTSSDDDVSISVYFQPANRTSGATEHEIRSWLVTYTDQPVIRFHSLYNAFANFADARLDRTTLQVTQSAFACSTYEQWPNVETLT